MCNEATEKRPVVTLRDHTTREQRCEDLGFTIDPGFVHRRKIETIIGGEAVKIIDGLMSEFPDSLPGELQEFRIDRVYTKVFLDVLKICGAQTLQGVIASQSGAVFCSVEELSACPDVWDGGPRVSNTWIPAGSSDFEVTFQYSTNKIRGDTLKSRLADGHRIAVAGEITGRDGRRLTVEPIIMGSPWIPEEGLSLIHI